MSTLWGIASDPNQLVTLNPATGAITSAVPITGLSPGRLITLAYDTTTTTMYANTAIFSAGTSDLYTIDTGTGAATLIGALGVDDFNGLAFDASGQLYGWARSDTTLYTIDKLTAAITAIGDTLPANGHMFDIAFRPEDGVLFASDIFDDELQTVNTGTAVPTTVGPYVAPAGNIAGLAFLAADIPEPATLAVLGFGLAGLGLARRRRR